MTCSTRPPVSASVTIMATKRCMARWKFAGTQRRAELPFHFVCPPARLYWPEIAQRADEHQLLDRRPRCDRRTRKLLLLEMPLAVTGSPAPGNLRREANSSELDFQPTSHPVKSPSGIEPVFRAVDSDLRVLSLRHAQRVTRASD